MRVGKDWIGGKRLLIVGSRSKHEYEVGWYGE